MKRTIGLTKEDAYFDGLYDPRYEIFCEELQMVFSYRMHDGWDTYDHMNRTYDDSWELSLLNKNNNIKNK
ncbi:hypothetical protein [Paenibacillus sp. HB172176]|uniref:hypothetical protein n=1 Tax=Paenibacillus sp. HB172176 TaxID=2493690 RepID=UPI00143B47F3|nr:hypothetical protein [Paenibacillus sp. HB172176]